MWSAQRDDVPPFSAAHQLHGDSVPIKPCTNTTTLPRAAVPADIDRRLPAPPERRELVAPGPPALRKVMDQNHERTLAELDRVDPAARHRQVVLARAIEWRWVHHRGGRHGSSRRSQV